MCKLGFCQNIWPILRRKTEKANFYHDPAMSLGGDPRQTLIWTKTHSLSMVRCVELRRVTVFLMFENCGTLTFSATGIY